MGAVVTGLGSEEWGQSESLWRKKHQVPLVGIWGKEEKQVVACRDFAVGPSLLQGKCQDCSQGVGLTLFSG